MRSPGSTANCKLRVRCLVCRRRLRDTASLLIGIGPSCRRKYNYEKAVLTGSQQREANDIILRLAQDYGDPDVEQQINRLREIGLVQISELVRDRLATIKIESRTVDEATYLDVRAPYREDAVAAWRSIPSRQWRPEERVNRIRVEDEPALRELLAKHYRGLVGTNPDGTAFRVPGGVDFEERFWEDTTRSSTEILLEGLSTVELLLETEES